MNDQILNILSGIGIFIIAYIILMFAIRLVGGALQFCINKMDKEAEE